MYDYTQHGDFTEYYDVKTKRVYWVIGYASNISIPELFELAKKYAKLTNCDINTIKVDEILYSRRFKQFKYIYSTQELELPKTVKPMNVFNDVWKWLAD